jgi:hypothetical protein
MVRPYVPTRQDDPELALIAQAISAKGKTGYYTETLVLPKTAGKGIKVDTDVPTFGWRDIIGRVIPKAVGVGSPARAIYAGGTIADYAFVANDVCDFGYHIPHDYVAGTDLYFHVHWSHTDAVSITGNASFTAYHTYAKGFNQANFPAEKNIVITHATTDLATTPQYRHRVDEGQLSSSGGSATLMDSALLEPDGFLIITLQLSALPTFGGLGKLFIHTCDIHYQSTNISTKQKAAPFYV